MRRRSRRRTRRALLRATADEGIVPSTGAPAPATSATGSPGSSSHAPRTGLLARLLNSDKHKRIGCLKNGAEDIKKHKWFRGLNWAALYNKQMAPALGEPMLSSDDDHHCFATYPDTAEETGPLLDAAKNELFNYY